MISGWSCNIKRLTVSLLLLSGLGVGLFSQNKINGPINKYGHVTSIGSDYVLVDDPAQFLQFKAGDTILLVQMKGAMCTVPDDANYGIFQTYSGTPGGYEFLTVLSVEGASKKITFRNNIIKSYDVQGDVQIVRVPSYSAAIVDAELNCAAWDSTTKTGGVLTMIVGTTLKLNANINVRGKGFAGGAAITGLGNCIEAAANSDNYFYPSSYQNSGLKGESHIFKAYISGPLQYPIYPGYAKGRGPNFTSGGGGSGRFSGGGGGSLYGIGGKGGLEQLGTCTAREYGGLGGKTVRLKLPSDGILLGGGGGGSTYLAGATPSAGGRGGGIIIIICETLDGNGFSIIADGETPVTASGNAGSGGGGSGGTIAIYLQRFSSTPVIIAAKGGNGGNNAGQFGEGGGGGGGLININNLTIPGTVTRSVLFGQHGSRSGVGFDATSGTSGDNITAFYPSLNGFLFNSIWSSVTGSLVDSICSNKFFGQISGTDPVGGTTPLTYLWESSTTSEAAGFGPAAGTNNQKHYTPPGILTQTTWFRRVIKDSGTPLLTDISKPVKVIVHQAITGNSVGKDTIICYNQNPKNLIPLNAGPSNGNGIYAYQWIQNPNNSDWTSPANATGTGNISDYDPPALTSTTFYKRIVTSGRCVDTSSVVTINVLPLITGNITTRPDSVICEGSLFNTLGASLAGGGDLAFKYQWQDSTAAGLWLPAFGTNTGTNYTPDTSKFRLIENRYLRRVVYSGADSVCRNNSSPILMTRYHLIKNNSIAADTTICSGTTPPSLSGTIPQKGSGAYSYIWEGRTKLSSWTTIVTSPFTYSPPALSDTTWYRRIVNSSKCADTSKLIVIKVHKPIANNAISIISGSGADTTICSGAVPNKLKGSTPSGGTNLPGDYAYQWSYSTDNVSYTDIVTSGNGLNFQPANLTVTTWFKRRVLSGKCFSESNVIRIIVLPKITNNIISGDQTICHGITPSQITGPVLTGGSGTPTWLWQQSSDAGASWLTASGTFNQQNYSPTSLTIPMKYRRIILSGSFNCCIDTSNTVSIGIYSLPTGTITSVTDTTICSGSQVLLKIHLTGASAWKVVYNAGSAPFTINKIADADTIIKVTPAVTASLTTIIYSLASVVDKNNCIATSLTGNKKADVYRIPVANAGPDSSVCGPEYTLSATPSDGIGKWFYPSEVVYSTTNAPVVTIKIDSAFTQPNVTYKFFWEEKNWQCINKDSVKITFDRRIKPGGSSDTTVYTFDNMIQLKTDPLQTGETGEWSVVSGSGDFDDFTHPSTDVRNISIGINTYLWSVVNGKCSFKNLVTVEARELIIPEGFSPNNDIYNNTFIIRGLDLRMKYVPPDSVPAYQVADLTILNGAGTQVFSTTNRNGNKWVDWDGKNSKGLDLPAGTYYYLIKITSLGTGEVFQKSGFVILKRY